MASVPTRGARAAASILVAAALAPLPAARAELHPLSDGRARIGEPSWADLVEPDRRDARLLARQGLSLLLEAMGAPADGIEPSSQLQIERALDRFDRAVQVLDRDPELAFLRGVALASFVREEPSGRVVRRTDEAIAELERARALDPTYEPHAVAWQLAFLHTRAQRFDRAAEEYERARRGARLPVAPLTTITGQEEVLYLLFAPPDLGLLALNLAEVEMLGGELARARAHYEESRDRSERGSLSRALALFGLALAEERDGAHLEALATAHEAVTVWVPSAQDLEAQALLARYGPVAALHHSGVTFEPRWERHAYEALAYEALAVRAEGAESRASNRMRAVRALRAFFAVGGAESRYAGPARSALERLESE